VTPWAGRWALRVHDTRWALWRLAERIRRDFAGEVIGVTGSVGKTTTRQMIHAVLGRGRQGTASPRNFNNYLGVPLTMAHWQPLDDYAVVELGASGPGEIDALARLCRPEIGVVTCIAEAHLGGFGSLEAIAEAKTELLAALPKSGHAVLGDDPWLRRLAHRSAADVTWIGVEENCDVVATDIESRDGRLSFCVENQRFRVPVWGRHHLTAALAAIAVGRLLGVRLKDAAEALADYQPVPQRSRVLGVSGMTVIDDTYNASPTSMRAALKLLREINCSGRRIVVCGDLCEMGETSSVWHRRVGEQAVTLAGADLLIVCGQHAEEIAAGAREAGLVRKQIATFDQPADALPLLRREAGRGDALLFKASRAVKLEQLLETLLAEPLEAAA
jgi:UDP-N-acetylmuramoyl-tripeptide--D-alanyl-D-alanine ligase